jgi:hypothetical protein
MTPQQKLLDRLIKSRGKFPAPKAGVWIFSNIGGYITIKIKEVDAVFYVTTVEKCGRLNQRQINTIEDYLANRIIDRINNHIYRFEREHPKEKEMSSTPEDVLISKLVEIVDEWKESRAKIEKKINMDNDILEKELGFILDKISNLNLEYVPYYTNEKRLIIFTRLKEITEQCQMIVEYMQVPEKNK